MTTAASELDKYEGKKITLTVTEADGSQKEVEGKAEKSNAMGVLIKPKGKTGLELYSADQIVSVEAAPEKPKEIKAKNLKLVEVTTAKQHLVDRHGYSLKDINGMEEEAAFTFHENTVDHEGLGHQHVAKEDKPADGTSDEAATESGEAEEPAA